MDDDFKCQPEMEVGGVEEKGIFRKKKNMCTDLVQETMWSIWGTQKSSSIGLDYNV